jgi:hypothetical protein
MAAIFCEYNREKGGTLLPKWVTGDRPVEGAETGLTL